MKNVLFVSISGPPSTAAESLQVSKYLKYLMKHDLKITYVSEEVDKSRLSKFSVESSEYACLPNQVSQYITLPVYYNKYIYHSCLRLFPCALELPDRHVSFAWQWRKVVKTLKEKPDVIYSRSTPYTSTLAALKLQKYFNIPWIMHLSDPWVDSPFHNYSAIGKKYNKNLERKCFEAATKISLTSQKTIEFYKNKYPEYSEKFILFPNVYDEDHINKEENTRNSKLTFVHTGNFYGNRSPEALFKALQLIEEKDKALLTNVEFIFVGSSDKISQKLFDDNRLSCVKYLGQVPYSEAIELQRKADVLISVDSPLTGDMAMFFPSKLLDYLIAKKEILAITSRDSTTYEVVHNKSGVCFEHQDIAGISSYFLDCINRHNSGKPGKANQEVDIQYSAGYNAKMLYNVFDTLSNQ